MLLLKRKMGPKKGRRMRKKKVPTDIPAEFELEQTAADIQRRKRKRKERHRNNRGGEGEGVSQEGGNYTLIRGGSGQKAPKN